MSAASRRRLTGSCNLITVNQRRLCDLCADPTGSAVNKANFCGHMFLDCFLAT